MVRLGYHLRVVRVIMLDFGWVDQKEKDTQ